MRTPPARSGSPCTAHAGPTDCGYIPAAIGFGNVPNPVPGAASSVSFVGVASRPAVVGGTMSDTAAIASSAGPTGSVTFDLYGPGAASCTGPPAFTSTVPVNGNGSYTSASYVPVAQAATGGWPGTAAMPAARAWSLPAPTRPSRWRSHRLRPNQPSARAPRSPSSRPWLAGSRACRPCWPGPTRSWRLCSAAASPADHQGGATMHPVGRWRPRWRRPRPASRLRW